ncbi:efflux RND transporter permease subunit [Oceanicoccus sagamiensis]|uniref:Multidrug transporter n=1 Tax=Oceanicoccus sagamiensis TaxID=716816 RepID=A0A1X9NA46_9GAMM|nr:efflux RND transporter permease subunit [Oceanicoccus sagamiensis]ARN74928.1 multidrug transporter [Oceanicoccus sagamiensis]
MSTPPAIPPTPPLETGIIAWMARNPVAANLLMLVVMVAGIQSLFTITKEVYPTFSNEVVTITVPYPGSSPEEVEQGILIKVEEKIQDIVGIREIRSTANEGSGVVRVEFDPGTDMSAATSKVKVRVDSIASFPLDAEPPVIEEGITRNRVLNLTLYGDLREEQLKQLADNARDELLAMPDITQVDVTGSRDYEIAIEVSNLALRQYGLQFDDVVNAVRNQSKDLPGGKLRTDSGSISLRSMGQAYTEQEFEALTLVSREDGTRITVGDVASVIDGFEDQPYLSRLNGRSGITLKVMRVGRQSALMTSDRVNAYAERLRQRLPVGVEVSVWADRTEVLESRMNLLLKSAAQGVLLVMIVLTLFLQTTLAFWVVMGLPFCFLGALLVMSFPMVDLSINIVSLFGFILVLGILVDDAIVTGESAYNQLEKEDQGMESIIRGVKRVAVPTIFGVLTTILAFMPLMLMEEGIGRLFSYAGPVIIFCLIFSLIETKLVLPAHLRHIKLRNTADNKRGVGASLSRVQQRISSGLKNFAQYRYQPVLKMAVTYRYISLAIFIAVFIITFAFFSSGILRFVFFPSVPSNGMKVTLQMPQGTSYQQTHAYSLDIEKAALAVNDNYRERWDKDVILALEVEAKKDNEAVISVELVPSTERDITSVELANRWREKIGDLPGVKALSVTANAGFSGLPVNIELQSNDLTQLRLAAEEVKMALLPFDGVYDVRDTFDAGGPEVDIRITPEGQALGLGQAELARQVRQAFFGAEIQRLQRDRHEVRVYVRFPAEQRQSLETLRSMWIQLPASANTTAEKVPFDVVGEIIESTGVSTITRINRHRVVNVQADVDKLKTTSSEVVATLEAETLPGILAKYPAVDYRLSGEAEEQAENTNSLVIGTLVMLIMVYAALAIPLKSYGQPLIIMSVIPFGVVGAFLGHMIMGMPISIISFIGIVALSGVVVNDSLVLVDYINQRVREGIGWCDAVLDAGVRRFRAVILTSVTTFVGLLPIQLETSIQSQFLKPMAISVAFGVLFATVVTLLLIPVLCFIVDDIRQLMRRAKGLYSSTQTSLSGSPKSS